MDFFPYHEHRLHISQAKWKGLFITNRKVALVESLAGGLHQYLLQSGLQVLAGPQLSTGSLKSSEIY